MKLVDVIEFGYRYAVGWNQFMLNFIGAWPRSSKGISKYKTWFCFFCVLIFIWIPLIASIYPLWGNMDAVIECLSISIPLIIAMMKLVIFYYYKKEMKIFIDLIAKDWTINRRDNEKIPMMKMANLSRAISIISGLLISSTVIAFILFKVWMATQIQKKQIDHDSNVAIDLLYPAYLPYSTKDLKYYLLTWVIQCFATLFSPTAYASFDSFMSMILLHICGQLAIVGISIKNLVNETNFKNIYKFRWSLGQIVKRHEELNQFIELIENSFCIVLLPQMLVCTLAFCFQGYMLTMSTLITQTCYESNWFNLPFREARLLIFINYRSHKPLTITAGKFCSFSRHLFIMILKTSFGYLSMLLAVKQ
ncbi:uncharacterized protein LOC128667546 [Microplitis demolitor]|uniref:uncharacterized protein LOC128667546 n=1 Tax=Microplitis demolitor TaxID=69319 RepID=UPI00235B6BF7|nr:uncharacterized protein LOC128667546 [Microplitis demolitor]